MANITLKGNGDPHGIDLCIDGREPHVRSLDLHVTAGEITRLDVEYVRPGFNIEQDGVRVNCTGTDLGEDEERAVLAYLQAKYQE